MNDDVSIKSKRGEEVFQVLQSVITQSVDQEKGGEHLYLLEYDYAKDLLVNNKDPDEVVSDIKSLCCVLEDKLQGEEFYVLVSTVLEADMVKAYANIEFGSLLKLDHSGAILADLLDEEKDAFSVVDENEIDDLNLDELFDKSKNTGEYVDPTDALVAASKKEGAEAYGRKDVLKKFAEEKSKNQAS